MDELIVPKPIVPKKRHYILPAPFLLLGVACVFFGVYGAIDDRAVASRAVRVPGTVVGMAQHTFGKDQRLYTFARFRFTTLDGRVLSHMDEFPDSYEVGEHITVMYDPQNLRAVYVNQLPPWSWKRTVVAILVGVLFLGAAVLAWSGG